jgi:hypothetical protein
LSVLQAFPLSVHSKSFSPLSYPFLKLDPRLCNPLLRHYIYMYYVPKISDWTKGSRTLEISKSRIFKIKMSKF